MKRFPDCEEYKDDNEIVLKENKSKLTFDNSKRDKILKIKVDGCAIDDENKRCDYALVCSNVEIYVELKGSKIAHAVEQIESTIKLLSDNPQKIDKRCFVVFTRFGLPKGRTNIQIIKSKFNKKYNATLIVEKTPYTYDLSQVTI
ncbi:hypothetical protein [Moorena sp. SIO4A5]|uniref:hypothetical protein n=1 Tax=Moorena sp. SIO4A5 TaxID=2607838 RepID=UPI0013C7DFF1|nr:hypothetical protein [Moorena sp. SIO4A5]NEO18694.1 hypothetical protein [Moorena sp. SIO4A5]